MSIVEETSTFSLVRSVGPMSWDTLRKHQDRNFKGEVFEIFINSWVAPELFGVEAYKPVPDLGSDGQIDGEHRIRFSMKNEQNEVTKAEVSIFHTNGGDTRSDDELWFFSASPAGRNAKIAIDSLGINHLYGDMLREYWDDFQEYLFSQEQKAVILPEMYHHQKEAVDIILTSPNPAMQIIIAMGGGKTRTAAEAIARTDGMTLFVAPTIKIADQSEKAIADAAGRQVLAVHSGPRGTTNIDVVSKFIEANNNLVIVAVYDSIGVVAEAANGKEFSLAFADEAHSTAGTSEHGEVTDRRVFHFNELINLKKRVYLTATRRSVSLTDKMRADDGLLDAYSMDDESIFGKVEFERTFTQCVEDGILVPIAIHAMIVSDDDAFQDISLRNIIKNIGGGVTALDYSFVRSTLKSLSKYHPEGAQTICFTSEGTRARSVEKLINAVAKHEGFNVETIKYYSDKAYSSSDKALDEFCKRERNGVHRFIVNVRNLAEGYDNPELDAIMYFNAKSTDIGWAQSVSRASRQRQGKTMAKVYIPIPIEDGKDCEKVISKTGYDRILGVANIFNSFGITIHQVDLTASGVGNLSSTANSAMSFTMPLNNAIKDIETLRNNVEMVIVNGQLPQAVYMTGQPCPGPANEESEGDTCGKPIDSNGFCDAHAKQFRKFGGDLSKLTPLKRMAINGGPCPAEPNKLSLGNTCGLPVRAKGFCAGHYQQMKKWGYTQPLKVFDSKVCGGPAAVGGSGKMCGNKATGKGLCASHHRHLKMYGELRPLNPGKRNGLTGQPCQGPADDNSSEGVCGRKIDSHGLCLTHAKHLKKYGKTFSIKSRKKMKENREAFKKVGGVWEKSDKDPREVLSEEES